MKARLYSNTMDKEKTNMSELIVPALAAVLFSVLSITAISVFQMQISVRKFRIYYYCGMEHGKDIIIHICYLISVIITSLIISVIAYFIIGLFEYTQRIETLTSIGFSFDEARTWTSISDYVKVTPGSVSALLIIAVIIATVSSSMCGVSFKKSG